MTNSTMGLKRGDVQRLDKFYIHQVGACLLQLESCRLEDSWLVDGLARPVFSRSAVTGETPVGMGFFMHYKQPFQPCVIHSLWIVLLCPSSVLLPCWSCTKSRLNPAMRETEHHASLFPISISCVVRTRHVPPHTAMYFFYFFKFWMLLARSVPLSRQLWFGWVS
jgi:hypothetical protein